MKKILCLALILALFATAAYAEQDTILTVSALRNVHQTEFIRELCFGDEYRDVVITSNLGEVEGYREGRQGKAPYFIAGPDRSRKPVLQSHYYIRRSDDKAYWFDRTMNAIPNGIVVGGITMEEARILADEIAKGMDLPQAEFLYITAYGRIKGAKPVYKAVYVQKHDGLPLYWGLSDGTDEPIQPNAMEIILDAMTGDLVELEAHWSLLISAQTPHELRTEDEAIAMFSKLGVEPKGMERCYYLTPYSGRGDEAMAYPAYRVGGNFYDLFYGRVMQTSIVPEYQFEPLEPGQRGSGVNAMQKQLVKLGYLDAATGLYDDSTTEAVRLFQQKNSLYEDGIAGSATLKRIYSEDAVANN